MPDILDDDKLYYRQKDMSAGQFSYPHPDDDIIMPPNAGAELLNADIDELGKRCKRKGYVIKADDLGSSAINGLVGYSPVGGSKTLVMETNGTVYTWPNSGDWTSSLAGQTAATYTELVVAKGKVFRLSQTDNIQSYDGSSWTEYTNPIDPATGAADDPPKGKLGIWTSNQRFIVANTSANPNFAYPSDAGDPETFGDSAFQFGDRDSDGITGMIEFVEGEVIVFTRKAMYSWDITNTTSSNWTVKKIADIGCIAPRSIKQLGQDVLFLSQDGVRSVILSSQDKKRGASLPISFPITDYIHRISFAYGKNAVATVWNDKYMLSVAIDSAQYNNYCFIFSRRAFEANGQKGGWTIYDNWNSNCYAIHDFGDVRRLYMGEASGDSKVYLVRSDSSSDEATSDNGTAIDYEEISRRIDFDSPEHPKTFSELELEVIEQDSGTLTVQAQVDGEGWTTVGTLVQSVSTPTLPVALPFTLVGGNKVRGTFDLENLGRGRNIQIKITESTLDAPVQIIGYAISAFLENVEFES